MGFCSQNVRKSPARDRGKDDQVRLGKPRARSGGRFVELSVAAGGAERSRVRPGVAGVGYRGFAGVQGTAFVHDGNADCSPPRANFTGPLGGRNGTHRFADGLLYCPLRATPRSPHVPAAFGPGPAGKRRARNFFTLEHLNPLRSHAPSPASSAFCPVRQAQPSRAPVKSGAAGSWWTRAISPSAASRAG